MQINRKHVILITFIFGQKETFWYQVMCYRPYVFLTYISLLNILLLSFHIAAYEFSSMRYKVAYDHHW